MSNNFVLNPNGGSGMVLSLGTIPAFTRGVLNFDLSAGGSLVTTSGSAVTTTTLGYATVKDGSGTGFASIAAAASPRNVTRLTGQTTLPTATPTSTVDYIATASTTTSAGASFSVNTLTVDSSAGAVVLDLGGNSDVMTLTIRVF